MKRALPILAALLLGAALLSLSGCTGAGGKEYPEHYAQFTALLGLPRETVLARLELEERDLVPGPKGLSSIPVTADFCGLTFDVMLEFDEINDRLLGFCYTKEWAGRWDDAIRDAAALSRALTDTFGPAREDGDPRQFSRMSREELAGAFSAGGMQTESDFWLAETRDDTAAQEYAALLREQKKTPGEIADRLDLTLQMQVSASRAADAAAVLLRFRLEPGFL